MDCIKALIISLGLIGTSGLNAQDSGQITLHTKIQLYDKRESGQTFSRSTRQKVQLTFDEPTLLSKLHSVSSEQPDSTREVSFQVTARRLANDLVELDYLLNEANAKIILKVDGHSAELEIKDRSPAQDGKSGSLYETKIWAKLTSE